MANKNGVWALNAKGEVSFCVSPLELRGKGRCNHIAHQQEGQSTEDFLSSIEQYVRTDWSDNEGEIADQRENILKIIEENGTSFSKNPDWEEVIKNKIPNYFKIGKDETYEEAELVSVEQKKTFNDDGDPVVSLEANYNFRGNSYAIDMGEIPEVLPDGSIQINGSYFRCLPVLSQFKSGVTCYSKKTIIKQESGHLAMVLEPGEDNVMMRGVSVPLSEVQAYFNGESNSLTDIQKYDLDNIDPIAFERFPNIKKDLAGFRDSHTPDDPGDIAYRKVITYEDQVAYTIDAQMRRMGVTFRTNLARKQDSGMDETDPQYPLFYQKNITSNVKMDLLGRSNVQLADNLNPLSALSQTRKISLAGPGGFNKKNPPSGLRRVHPSHEDLIDGLDISAGKNLGLTLTLADADVDKRGFIVKSDTSKLSGKDFIPYRMNTDLNRAGMAVGQMKQAVPIIGGEDPRLLGDPSDKAWSSIRGSKIGANVRIAYVPAEGTYEDAMVMSKSCAAKFATVQNTKYKYKSDGGDKAVSIGREVREGDEINGVKVKYDGKIAVAGAGGFEVETKFEMREGDKISGRYGNKGIISRVVDDAKMPQIRQMDGTYKPAELVMSPTAVAGRMNISQIKETNGGDINKKTNVKLPNGTIVQNTAGVQFVSRLNHIAEKKLSAYANEKGSDRESKGMRFGEMEGALLGDTPGKRNILSYLHEQEGSDAGNKLSNIFKAIGVDMKIE